ncbi:MAG: phosphoglycerate kinase [Christensenellaceae bacterium]|jgi:phosphoglycerate kinase|nr:phosphoglycerate kinase [Christensenellaceae bacterium]
MSKKTIEDIAVSGKRVLVRCDFNVPLDGGTITDETRITAALPTIQYLLKNKARVILCSHLGRPKGEFKAEFSLAPVARRLTALLGQEVALAADVIGQSAQKLSASLKDGEVMLLENVRFHKEEEKNDEAFSKALASLADVYVNDAFGTAHRAHASTEGVAKFLPAVAGYLIGKELSVMGKALEDPIRPFVAILGGKKVSDKIGVINNLLEKVDSILIGGAMSYTFSAAQGGKIGKSLLEADKVELAASLIKKAQEKGVKLLLPVDTVCADAFSNDANISVHAAGQIPDDLEGLDIGPETIELFAAEIAKAKTIIWNGPMGVFEMPKFAVGTVGVAKAMAENSGAVTIIGGGDSAAAVEQLGFADKMSHISTGGGASLEFLEGIELPGVAALNNK